MSDRQKATKVKCKCEEIMFNKTVNICGIYRAVKPPHLQILRIDVEGMRDDIIMHRYMTSFVKKKNT